MPTSEASVVIPRPISVVWDYCAEAANLAIYTPGTIEVQAVTVGPLAVGTQWRGRTRFLGPTMDWQGEFAKVVLNEVTVFQSTTAPFGFTATTRFEETDDGTRFTYHLDTESGLGGLFGRLTDPIVAKAYARGLKSSLENLVDVLG